MSKLVQLELHEKWGRVDLRGWSGVSLMARGAVMLALRACAGEEDAVRRRYLEVRPARRRSWETTPR